MSVSHQTVRLSPGRHRSASVGVCVMELASMLSGERFSDRARSISPVIGAFLRTYNDGVDDDRRQDLYRLAAAIVGTAAGRGVERDRVSACLAFAYAHGGAAPRGRAALALGTPEAAGSAAAVLALRDPSLHEDALALADELIAMTPRRRRLRWHRRAQPAARVDAAVEAWWQVREQSPPERELV
jgi:hypothetical protein